jgi:hypothetical protein
MGWLLWNIVRALAAIAVFLAVVIESSAQAGVIVAAGGEWDPTRFYAGFTIQASLLAFVTLLWAFRRRDAPPSRRLDLFRGATTAYFVVILAISLLVVPDDDIRFELTWVDALLTKALPAFLVVDWLLDPPDTKLRFTDALWWLIYPVIWIVLTLVRGAADGWYPYPLLDPNADGGYGAVAACAAGFLVGLLVVSAILIWLGNWRASQSAPREDLQEPATPQPPEPPGWENPGGPGTPP